MCLNTYWQSRLLSRLVTVTKHTTESIMQPTKPWNQCFGNLQYQYPSKVLLYLNKMSDFILPHLHCMCCSWYAHAYTCMYRQVHTGTYCFSACYYHHEYLLSIFITSNIQKEFTSPEGILQVKLCYTNSVFWTTLISIVFELWVHHMDRHFLSEHISWDLVPSYLYPSRYMRQHIALRHKPSV